jgi:hypothetical protein
VRLIELILLLPQAGGAEYVGSAACAECHQGIAKQAGSSRHAHALKPIGETPLAAKLAAKPLRDQQGNEYTYRSSAVGLEAAVSGLTALLEWSFGSGAQGYTAVGRDGGGRWVEHRVSYFTSADRLARTPGHPHEVLDRSLLLGLRQSPDNAFRCFNCHATNVRRTAEGADLSAIELGVRCERCHGPGRRHIEAARAGQPAAAIRRTVFNAGAMKPRQIPEVCGECHRSPVPGVASETPELDDPLSIRFQPIGLLASSCFKKSGRLSCLTCHDPHEDAKQDVTYYSAKCVACHVSPARARTGCPRTPQANCLPCHMPRSSPAPFLTFTDHRIRRL